MRAMEKVIINLGIMKFSLIFSPLEDDEIPPQYDSEEVKSAISIQSTFKADPMSTSFYGALPESTIITTSSSDHATSVPIPISQSTVTRTYVEYTSSPETGGIEKQTKKFTKYLDDADLDFEKTFQQQSAIVTTITSQTIQSSSTDTKESTSSTIVTTTTTSTTEKETTEKDSKDEKLWEKPLGEFSCKNLF